jgi:hypothetical protein
MNIPKLINDIHEAYYINSMDKLISLRMQISKELKSLEEDYARGTIEYQTLNSLHKLIVTMEMKHYIC